MRFAPKRAKRSTPRINKSRLPRIGVRGLVKRTSFNPAYVLPVFLIALCISLIQLAKITTVSCVVDRTTPCPAQVQAIVEQNKGKQALLVDPKRIEATLLQALPQFEMAAATITLPQSLRVALSSSQPLVQIVTASESASLVVNTNHVITEFLPNPHPDLFSITSMEPLRPQVGMRLDDQSLLAATKLYELLLERNIAVTSVVVVSAQRIEVLSNNVKYLFTSFRSLEHQVTSLQIILGTDTMESNVSVIDLRPERPVLQ
jgi:hypothetical protein